LSGWNLHLLAVAYCLRMLTLWIVYRGVFSRLQCSDLLQWIPVLDVLLAMYYGLAVPYYLVFSRPIVWK